MEPLFTPRKFWGGVVGLRPKRPRWGLGLRSWRRSHHGLPSSLLRHGLPSPWIRHGLLSPLTRHGSRNGRRSGGRWSCSLEVSRAPPPPPCWLVGVRWGEGGVVSWLWTVLLCFCSPCAPCDPVSPQSDCLIWSQVCLLSSLVTLSLKAPVLSVSVCWSLNVFPACIPCFQCY